MKFVVGILCLSQVVTWLFLAWPQLKYTKVNPLSDLQVKYYERYEKPATLDTVITEIQRASFCQNLVIPMVDEWKENKDKKNASLKEKLGPALWERCNNYVWSPVVIPDKKK